MSQIDPNSSFVPKYTHQVKDTDMEGRAVSKGIKDPTSSQKIASVAQNSISPLYAAKPLSGRVTSS